MKRPNLPTVIFNITETLLLFLSAYFFKIKLRDTLLVLIVFQISRFYFKLPKHYKDWQKCLIWTLIIFTSLFIVARVDISVGIMCSIFSAYILSGQADIKDGYLWNNGSESKYKLLEDYIKYKRFCDNNALKNVENQLKTDNPELYMIYKRRFLEHKTFSSIRKEFDIENPRIVESLDKVYLIIKYSLKI